MLPKEYQEKGISAQGYRYTYDLAGRKLSTTAPDGTLLEQNTYDTTGRLVRQLEGATFGYDLTGRQVKITTPEGNSQQFAYDAMGNMTATTDGMGNTTAFTVDEWAESPISKRQTEAGNATPTTM
ncbi:MAG: RHS repeat protein [Lachnospiraceae bacterium]|nr:RHS repeat protein [Lachnospiraceae bacterium]